MTLTVCWIVRGGDVDQMCVASDSRLRSVGEADECQKIFPLDEGRLCVAFCGDTHLAFPIIHLLDASLRNSRKFWDGSKDVFEEQAHFANLINSFNDSRSRVDPAVWNAECRDTKLVLCGYSWVHQRFVIFRIAYNKGTKKFEFGNMRGKTIKGRSGYGTSVVAIGDAAAREAFFRRLSKRRMSPLNLDPLTVLQEVLDSKTVATIGGVVQLLKMYRHGGSLPIAIKHGNDTFLFGRRLQRYEKTTYPILNLETKQMSFPLEHVKN